jgi:hypothetical protein
MSTENLEIARQEVLAAFGAAVREAQYFEQELIEAWS